MLFAVILRNEVEHEHVAKETRSAEYSLDFAKLTVLFANLPLEN